MRFDQRLRHEALHESRSQRTIRAESYDQYEFEDRRRTNNTLRCATKEGHGHPKYLTEGARTPLGEAFPLFRRGVPPLASQPEVPGVPVPGGDVHVLPARARRHDRRGRLPPVNELHSK